MSVTENTLPPEQQGPAAWIGNEMAADPSQWLSEWSEAEVAELEAAAEAFRSTGRDIGEIDTTQFPLPTIAPRLARLREKLTHGNGVEVITGLPVDRLDRWTAAAIFCGVGSHIGSARSQNAAGHILGHVRHSHSAREWNATLGAGTGASTAWPVPSTIGGGSHG